MDEVVPGKKGDNVELDIFETNYIKSLKLKIEALSSETSSCPRSCRSLSVSGLPDEESAHTGTGPAHTESHIHYHRCVNGVHVAQQRRKYTAGNCISQATQRSRAVSY